MNTPYVPKCALALIIVVLLLVLTGCEPQSVTPQSGQGVSPLRTPAPLDEEDVTSPPFATLTPPWWGTLTPEPQPTLPSWADPKWRMEYTPPTWVPFGKPDDVVKAVLNSPRFKADLNDPRFEANLEGAQAGTPIFVNRLSLPLDQDDYYLVPFYKKGKLTYIHQWLVKDGQGASGPGWSPAPGEEWPCCPPLSAAEAKRLAEAQGYQTAGEPRLVYRDLYRPRTSPVFPFWEIPTTAGELVYVIYDGYETQVTRQEDWHSAPWGLYPTPGPFPTPEWIAFNGPDDVARALMSSTGFKMSLADYKENLEGAQPGTPVFVKNLDPQGVDYYIVPFYKEGKVSYIQLWVVKDGQGLAGSGAGGPLWPCCPSVTVVEAKQLVEAKGYHVAGDPRLVYRSLAQPFTDDINPFWEVHTTDDQTWYVIWRPWGTEVWNVTDVKPF